MNSLSRIGLKIVVPALAVASLAGLALPAYADGPMTRGAPGPGYVPDTVEAADVIYRRAGGACDAGWQGEFAGVHGRTPDITDCRDRHWSLLFTQIRGRTPTDEDWKVHFFNNDGIFWDWREAPPLPLRISKTEQDPRLTHMKSG